MPFSSVLGASSVIKPGVCTSTTRPTVPYEGQLIYETDTDRVASYNGSAWVYTAASGLVLVKTQTIGTAVSSVAVTNAFSADYENYYITVSGGVASGTPDLQLQIGSLTSGYYWGLQYVDIGSNTTATFTATNGTNFPYTGSGNTSKLYAQCWLFGPQLAKPTEMRSIVLRNNGTSGISGTHSGWINNSTQYTDFTFLASSGTITGGIIRVYGHSNS